MEQLVRHFLIETGPRGVKIKGCQNEPHFGKQHSITKSISKQLNKADSHEHPWNLNNFSRDMCST